MELFLISPCRAIVMKVIGRTGSRGQVCNKVIHYLSLYFSLFFEHCIVSLTEESAHISINISDNGEGIKRSIIKNIFKPGVTSKKRGWGLGLSLSKRIVEEYHKGSLFVMQSEKGVGTTFTIRLPK